MKTLSYAFILVIFFASCSSNQEKPPVIDVPSTEKEAMKQTLDDKDRLDKTKQIYAVLPTPIETSVMLRNAGAVYKSTMLSEPNLAFDFQTSMAQALNLGIYGTDLSFAAAYGQESDVVSYFGSIKVLSDNLNISNAFSQELMSNVEENLENQTELLRLISEAYWSANNELTESERGTTSALVLAGGWIEAITIGLKIVDNNLEQKDIIDKVGQQRYTLELILDVLKNAADDEGVASVYQDFQSLNTIYISMPYTGEEFDVEDPVTGDIKKGILKNVKISPENLKELTDRAFEIREKYLALK